MSIKEELVKYHDVKNTYCPVMELIVSYRKILSNISKIEELVSKINDSFQGTGQLKQQLINIIEEMEKL